MMEIIPSCPGTVHSDFRNTSCLVALKHLKLVYIECNSLREYIGYVIQKCEVSVAFSPHSLTPDGTTGTIWSHLIWVFPWTCEYVAQSASSQSVYITLVSIFCNFGTVIWTTSFHLSFLPKSFCNQFSDILGKLNTVLWILSLFDSGSDRLPYIFFLLSLLLINSSDKPLKSFVKMFPFHSA